jgi:hypothetical protein
MSATSQARLNGVLGQTSMYDTFLVRRDKGSYWLLQRGGRSLRGVREGVRFYSQQRREKLPITLNCEKTQVLG